MSGHNVNQVYDMQNLEQIHCVPECNKTEYVLYEDCLKYTPYPELHLKNTIY